MTMMFLWQESNNGETICYTDLAEVGVKKDDKSTSFGARETRARVYSWLAATPANGRRVNCRAMQSAGQGDHDSWISCCEAEQTP
jgi:hypothetical protein